MTITVYLQYDPNDIRAHELAEPADSIVADEYFWYRDAELSTAERPVYLRQRNPKRAWEAQIAEEDSYSMGEGARREIFGD